MKFGDGTVMMVPWYRIIIVRRNKERKKERGKRKERNKERLLCLRVMSGRTSFILKFFKPTRINDSQGNELTSQEKLESRLAADRPRMEQEEVDSEKGAIAKRQSEKDIFELSELRSSYFAFLERDLTERAQRREA